MNCFRRLIPVLALVPWALTAPAFDAYLRLDGVDGESTDSAHPKWIDIESFTHAVSQPGRASFSELCLQKTIDSSSPVLAQSCALGKRFASANLDLVTTDASRVRFYEIGLTKVFVSSLSTDGGAGDAGRPTETLCLTYSRIGWSYTEVDPRGLPSGNVSAWWDLVLNSGGSSIQGSFSVTATQVDAGTLRLSWPAQAGKTYNILSSKTVSGGYQPLQSVTASSTGPMNLPVSITSGAKFFIVQEAP